MLCSFLTTKYLLDGKYLLFRIQPEERKKPSKVVEEVAFPNWEKLHIRPILRVSSPQTSCWFLHSEEGQLLLASEPCPRGGLVTNQGERWRPWVSGGFTAGHPVDGTVLLCEDRWEDTCCWEDRCGSDWLPSALLNVQPFSLYKLACLLPSLMRWESSGFYHRKPLGWLHPSVHWAAQEVEWACLGVRTTWMFPEWPWASCISSRLNILFLQIR